MSPGNLVVVNSRHSGFDGQVAMIIDRREFDDYLEAYQVLVAGQQMWFESQEVNLVLSDDLHV